MEKEYKKVSIVGTKDTFAYIEYQRKHMFMHKGRWIEIGKDIITGEFIVCDGGIYKYDDLIYRFRNHALLPGRLFLYGNFEEYLKKEEIASILNGMSEEKVKEYVVNIKKAKELYKEAKKEAKKMVKEDIAKDRHQKKDCKTAKRKVRSIARNF